MKKILITFFLVVIPSFGLACKEPQEDSMGSVLELFAVGDFIPHIPTVADIKLELGSIQEFRVGQDRFYTYRVDSGGWITFRVGEASQDKYAGIEEIIYGHFSPVAKGNNKINGKKLLSEKLMGVGLGDPISKLEVQGVAFRISEVELFGRPMTVYECTPRGGEDDLFYRYYVAQDKIEAFSMGVTE